MPTSWWRRPGWLASVLVIAAALVQSASAGPHEAAAAACISARQRVSFTVSRYSISCIEMSGPNRLRRAVSIFCPMIDSKRSLDST